MLPRHTARLARILHVIAHLSFSLFLGLTLLSYSGEWDQGPFAWGGVRLAGLPLTVGILSWLPVVSALSGAALWRLERRRLDMALRAGGLGWPLLALAGWIALNIPRAAEPAPVSIMLGLWGGVTLFVLNERPRLVWPLTLVLIGQSLVGIAQFVSQRSVGLTWLGEPTLDPQASGVSVVMNGEQRWLRAYGINSHPNRLGLKLTLLMLYLLGAREAYTGWARAGLRSALIVGGVGLLVSLSRSAWLGLAAGLAVMLWPNVRAWRAGQSAAGQRSAWQRRGGLILLVGVIFLGLYGNVVVGRFLDLDQPLEQRSLLERTRDTALALRLLHAHPWTGVGIGRYVEAAQTLDPLAGLVHNVPLLWGAELGWPGLLLWLWLWLTPLLRRSVWRTHTPTAAMWLALGVIGLFQPEISPFTMQGAVLLGLACGLMAQAG